LALSAAVIHDTGHRAVVEFGVCGERRQDEARCLSRDMGKGAYNQPMRVLRWHSLVHGWATRKASVGASIFRTETPQRAHPYPGPGVPAGWRRGLCSWPCNAVSQVAGQALTSLLHRTAISIWGTVCPHSNANVAQRRRRSALQVLRGHSISRCHDRRPELPASSNLLSPPPSLSSPPCSKLAKRKKLFKLPLISSLHQSRGTAPELAEAAHGCMGPSTHAHQALSCWFSRFSLVAPLSGASGGATQSTSPAPVRQCPTHR
jgi:hypothetical protein